MNVRIMLAHKVAQRAPGTLTLRVLCSSEDRIMNAL